MTGPDPIPGVDSRTTAVDGAGVRYLAAGGGDGPPVVLLHGGGIDEALLSWRPALPALATDHRILAPDWPGYGESDPPTEAPSPRYYRTVLLALLDDLGVGRASLVGISMGGAVALSFALAHPERVARLVAVDSYGLGGEIPGGILSALATRVGLTGLVFALIRRSERVTAAATRGVIAPENYHDDIRADVLAAANRPDAGRAFEAFQRAEVGLRGLRTNFVEELPELAAPTRFVHGERDPVVPVDWAVRAAMLVPDADCRVLRDCGHWAPRERPKRFLAAIEGFLG